MGRSRDSSAHGRGRLWATVGSTAATKVAVMGVSGLLGIVTSRLILTNFGLEAYANYGLLATLPQLLPFADLGIGRSGGTRIVCECPIDQPASPRAAKRTPTSKSVKPASKTRARRRARIVKLR